MQVKFNQKEGTVDIMGVPVNEGGVVSKSGKTLTHFTTGGIMPTGAIVDNRVLKANITLSTDNPNRDADVARIASEAAKGKK